jgi:hypothetical protein
MHQLPGRLHIWGIINGHLDKFGRFRPHLWVCRSGERRSHPRGARWKITPKSKDHNIQNEIKIEIELLPDDTIQARAFESVNDGEDWLLLAEHNCGEFLVSEFLERLAAVCDHYFPVPTYPDGSNLGDLSQQALRELADRLGIKTQPALPTRPKTRSHQKLAQSAQPTIAPEDYDDPDQEAEPVPPSA